MTLYCDWCGQPIVGEKQTGYSIEAMPFNALDIASARRPDKPRIVPEIHLHDKPCREAFFAEAIELANDHEPTPLELDYDHTASAKDDADDGGGKKDWEIMSDRDKEWRKLPAHAQDRIALEALGNARLTNRELQERLNKGDGPCPHSAGNSLSIVTRRLFKADELDRQEGQWGKSRVRYSRRKPSKEIKALEEAL